MKLRTIGAILSLAAGVQAQTYDLLLKGGRVIDPKNGRDGLMDVAITGNKIGAVAADISASAAKKVVAVNGLMVVPGLVDIHTHVYAGTNLFAHASGQYSVSPDDHTFKAGVTTVCDAGSSGWRNFVDFKNGVISLAKTRVLAWLNIVGMGLAGDAMPENAAVQLRAIGFDFRGLSTDALSQNVFDMDPRPAAQMAKMFPDVIVGFKSVQYDQPDWKNIDRIVEAGKLANRPVMIDFEHRFSQIPYEQLISEKLRPGDVSTHLYKPFQPILDKDGRVYPYLIEARKRGVIFDLGHSIGTFTFRVVVPAIRAGWKPDSLSTDLHADDMNRAAIDMTNLMSKMMAAGLSLDEVIRMTTVNPAREIHHPELGNLDVGADADVAVLRLETGDFGFVDVQNVRLAGKQKLECEMTIRDGKVVWDVNGRSAVPYNSETMPYQTVTLINWREAQHDSINHN
jgi:dihydroorotase